MKNLNIYFTKDYFNLITSDITYRDNKYPFYLTDSVTDMFTEITHHLPNTTYKYLIQKKNQLKSFPKSEKSRWTKQSNERFPKATTLSGHISDWYLDFLFIIKRKTFRNMTLLI